MCYHFLYGIYKRPIIEKCSQKNLHQYFRVQIMIPISILIREMEYVRKEESWDAANDFKERLEEMISGYMNKRKGSHSVVEQWPVKTINSKTEARKKQL
ncbi:hypothetical protein CEXT_71831 [Caerostris extrusa]|uniref:Uncharacterized protein n=1 Tax=Caerostris extrusa TaxID=172846 RepID=A0AAV4NGN4_CAEEX|nr:hypothetical protein CEXT_71831 [Caerostris extrusa]